MARFCSKCGAPLQEGSRFCGECGQAVAEEPLAPPQPPQQQIPQQQRIPIQDAPVLPQPAKQQSEDKEKDDRPWWLKALCTLLIFFVFVEVRYYMKHGTVILPPQIMSQVETAFNLDSKDVKLVKNGTLQMEPGVVIGKAFDNYFDDGKWTSFKSTDNRRIVEFNGGCTWKNKDAKCTIQFIVKNDSEFQVGAVAINGKELNTYDGMGVVDTVLTDK
jgi:hypothetical protein